MLFYNVTPLSKNSSMFLYSICKNKLKNYLRHLPWLFTYPFFWRGGGSCNKGTELSTSLIRLCFSHISNAKNMKLIDYFAMILGLLLHHLPLLLQNFRNLASLCSEIPSFKKQFFLVDSIDYKKLQLNDIDICFFIIIAVAEKNCLVRDNKCEENYNLIWFTSIHPYTHTYTW